LHSFLIGENFASLPSDNAKLVNGANQRENGESYFVNQMRKLQAVNYVVIDINAREKTYAGKDKKGNYFNSVL